MVALSSLSLAHPSYIHDWLEYPEMRTEIEALKWLM